MKRVVRASFGFRDQDWIDPPEDYVDVDSDTVVVTFDHVRIYLDEDYDNLYIQLDKLIDRRCAYTEEYSVYVGEEDVQEYVFEAILSKLGPEPEFNVTYELTGDVYVGYDVEVYTGTLRDEDSERIGEYTYDGTYTDDLTIVKVD